jgi:hypothetical protein
MRCFSVECGTPIAIHRTGWLCTGEKAQSIYRRAVKD